MTRVTKVLSEAGITNGPREATWLIEAAGGPSQIGFRDSAVAEDVCVAAIGLARRRAGGEPLQYLTGIAGFRYLELQVGPGVLVPRPETEMVAGRAIELLPDNGIAVDVGTGSGAIALAIAQERPDSDVHATEISEEAVPWAMRNIAGLGIPVRLHQGDLFDPLDVTLKGCVDLVVSNPPYVAPSEKGLLAPDVIDHEPHVALFSEGEGLDVIRRLTGEARDWLRPDGWLVLEVAEMRATDTVELLKKQGYVDVGSHNDLTGRPRIVEGRMR